MHPHNSYTQAHKHTRLLSNIQAYSQTYTLARMYNSDGFIAFTGIVPAQRQSSIQPSTKEPDLNLSFAIMIPPRLRC